MRRWRNWRRNNGNYWHWPIFVAIRIVSWHNSQDCP